MEDIKDVYITPVPESQFVRPLRFHYTQGGQLKSWDLLEVNDSVGVIVFNTDRKVMMLVKQFRPAVYYNSIHPKDRDTGEISTMKYPATFGISLEMCAGLVDSSKKSALETAKAEVLEELGYDVPLASLEKVISYRSGVGVQGAQQTMYYCEVADAMKVTPDHAETNYIEVVEKTIPEVERLIQNPGPHNSPPSCLFALLWFIHYKADRFRKSFERYCEECKPKKAHSYEGVLTSNPQ